MQLQTARLTLLIDPDRKEGFRRFGALQDQIAPLVVPRPAVTTPRPES